MEVAILWQLRVYIAIITPMWQLRSLRLFGNFFFFFAALPSSKRNVTCDSGSVRRSNFHAAATRRSPRTPRNNHVNPVTAT